MAGMKDGLGFEELVYVSGVGAMPSQSPTFNGSITAYSDISGANVYSAGTVTSDNVNTGSAVLTNDVITAQSLVQTTGSPFTEGTIIKSLVAITAISGGMWVLGSKGYAIAAPASSRQPLGYCISDVASGTAPEILVRGIAPFTAEGTIAAGDAVKMGAGGALNCALALGGSPSVIDEVGYNRGICVQGAGSESTCFVYLT